MTFCMPGMLDPMWTLVNTDCVQTRRAKALRGPRAAPKNPPPPVVPERGGGGGPGPGRGGGGGDGPGPGPAGRRRRGARGGGWGGGGRPAPPPTPPQRKIGGDEVRRFTEELGVDQT